MPTAFRFTSTDLEELPRWEGVRWEIIGGELYVSTVPHLNHQYVCGSIGDAFRVWDKVHGRGFSVTAPGLILTPEDDVVPDVVWMSRERFHGALNADGHLIAAPELIAEVLSPGAMHECRDRVAKLGLYSRHNIEEYWIVDWKGQKVEVHRRAGEELRLTTTLTNDDKLTSPLLPGFECAVASLWVPPVLGAS
jgi:Uma2 family endonuclease